MRPSRRRVGNEFFPSGFRPVSVARSYYGVIIRRRRVPRAQNCTFCYISVRPRCPFPRPARYAYVNERFQNYRSPVCIRIYNNTVKTSTDFAIVVIYVWKTAASESVYLPVATRPPSDVYDGGEKSNRYFKCYGCENVFWNFQSSLNTCVVFFSYSTRFFLHVVSINFEFESI